MAEPLEAYPLESIQMLGTITPLFLFPTETFTIFPIAPTLEGQYIIKNVVLISAAIVIGATVRGGRIVPDLVVARGLDCVLEPVQGALAGERCATVRRRLP